MGGLGLNGIKLSMAIEKIKILGVVLELLAKGQLISKCLLGVIVSTKKPTNLL
jgi:hypothetical protein